MDELLKEFEDNGITVEVGWKEKNRKKIILAALRKLRENGDEDKLNYVKTLYRYYCTINCLGSIFFKKDIPIEYNKYGLIYFCNYLDGIVESSKWIITDVIKAIGNDETLDPFSLSLMYTYMYTPEQVKEIGHEEIYRREQEFEKELGLV